MAKLDWKEMVSVAADSAEEEGVEVHVLRMLRRLADGDSAAEAAANTLGRRAMVDELSDDEWWSSTIGRYRRENFQWAESAADEIADEVQQGDPEVDDPGEVTWDRERAHDLAWERADSSSIYTYHNLQYLLGTENEDAIFDAGIGFEPDSFGQAVAQMAMMARLRDLEEALDVELDRREEEENEREAGFLDEGDDDESEEEGG